MQLHPPFPGPLLDSNLGFYTYDSGLRFSDEGLGFEPRAPPPRSTPVFGLRVQGSGVGVWSVGQGFRV
jgi:hypothetical protein